MEYYGYSGRILRVDLSTGDISKEQLDIILGYCQCDRDKAILNLLWYSGMRISECAGVKVEDFDWEEGTVVVLGKGNRYRKALAGNGIVRDWFRTHDSFGITTRGIKTMIQRLSHESGIKFSAHALRRGMAIHNLKQGPIYSCRPSSRRDVCRRRLGAGFRRRYSPAYGT